MRCLGAVLLLALAGSAEPAGTLPGRGTYAELRLDHAGRPRRYVAYLPYGGLDQLSGSAVIVLHGGGGSAENAARGSRMGELADRESFLVAYPQGTGARAGGAYAGTWNAGGCCGSAAEEKVDDVGFLSAVIDDLVKRYKVDRRSVYVAGISNGAQMAYRLACELSEKVAAVAAIGATGAEPECKPKRPIPIVHFHGTADRCSPYAGGRCGPCLGQFFSELGKQDAGRAADGRSCPGARAYAGRWAKRNGCQGEPKESSRSGNAVCETFGLCSQGADVTLCSIAGLGHVWPGGGYGIEACEARRDGYLCTRFTKLAGSADSGLNANEVMWENFSRFSLERNVFQDGW
ncbi:MAG: hypothetical protein HY554_08210 [Elusimicrobia bacterium]|nr:hypothetical protein [Elusimicrobiota bacterium]